MVPSCVTVSKWVKIFWEISEVTSVTPVRRKRSVQIAENYERLRVAVEAASQNYTSLTHFFVAFLTQYSTANVKAWSWLSPLQTANCSRLERNRFCQMERFLQTVFGFAFTGRHETFFSDEVHYELNECVNKHNMHCWLADNQDWQVTKSLHSKQVPLWCTTISQYFIIEPFFSKNKNWRPVSVNSMWYEEVLRTYFFEIEKTSSCPETNLVSTGHVLFTRYQFSDLVFKTRIWWSSHHLVCCILSATSEPDQCHVIFFWWGHLKANAFSTPVPDLLTLKS